MAVWEMKTYIAATILLLWSSTLIGSEDRPNVVFILADDLGWSDTTLYGTTSFYQTPNIAKLAARGMTFTHAYAASPLCSPTRAGILTGLSPARTGITSPTCHLPNVVLNATPGTRAAPQFKTAPVTSVNRLLTKYYTLGEALKDAGYATGHFGKWHLGHEPYSPLEHGFDIDVPHWPGPGPAGSYVAPWRFPDFDPYTPNEHIEDRMSREAVKFMEEHKEEPFFLNYWMFSVHAPFDAKKSLIDKHRQRVDPDDPQRSPTYAAMIESMDDAVGTLLETIDRLGLSDNTIIIFASDNGGNMYNEVDGTTPTSNAPLRGGKATIYEGGIRGPCIVSCAKKIPAGSRSDAVIQSCDFYPTLLEMLERVPRDGQKFDGVSIVPAFAGQSLKRDAIFTYFPHQPRVPEWVPPAVSVHRGDWKLIRIFYGGEDGAHRWKLFNLREDIGEKNDLAAHEPRRVEQLDALIEQFLIDTDAVRPIRNPSFDPQQYRAEEEGVARRKSAAERRPASTADRSKAKRVAGWRADHQCNLATKDGSLLITSTGNDPHLSYLLPKPPPPGELTIRITLATKMKGRGQLFWQEDGVRPAFFRDRSVTFDLKHDGEVHEYLVKCTAQHKVTAIRFDPGQGAGTSRVLAMSISNMDGEVIHVWSFVNQ